MADLPFRKKCSSKTETRSVYSQLLIRCAGNNSVPAEMRVSNLAFTKEMVLSTWKSFFSLFLAEFGTRALFLTKYTPELLILRFWLLRLFWLYVFSASLRLNEEGQK